MRKLTLTFTLLALLALGAVAQELMPGTYWLESQPSFPPWPFNPAPEAPTLSYSNNVFFVQDGEGTQNRSGVTQNVALPPGPGEIGDGKDITLPLTWPPMADWSTVRGNCAPWMTRTVTARQQSYGFVSFTASNNRYKTLSVKFPMRGQISQVDYTVTGTITVDIKNGTISSSSLTCPGYNWNDISGYGSLPIDITFDQVKEWILDWELSTVTSTVMDDGGYCNITLSDAYGWQDVRNLVSELMASVDPTASWRADKQYTVRYQGQSWALSAEAMASGVRLDANGVHWFNGSGIFTPTHVTPTIIEEVQAWGSPTAPTASYGVNWTYPALWGWREGLNFWQETKSYEHGGDASLAGSGFGTWATQTTHYERGNPHGYVGAWYTNLLYFDGADKAWYPEGATLYPVPAPTGLELPPGSPTPENYFIASKDVVVSPHRTQAHLQSAPWASGPNQLTPAFKVYKNGYPTGGGGYSSGDLDMADGDELFVEVVADQAKYIAGRNDAPAFWYPFTVTLRGRYVTGSGQCYEEGVVAVMERMAWGAKFKVTSHPNDSGGSVLKLDRLKSWYLMMIAPGGRGWQIDHNIGGGLSWIMPLSGGPTWANVSGFVESAATPGSLSWGYETNFTCDSAGNATVRVELGNRGTNSSLFFRVGTSQQLDRPY